MLKRLSNLIRGFFGLFISNAERRNPEALLEVEKENLRAQIAKYNQGLAAHAGLCERLTTQVKKLEIEERDLKAKTTANLKAGNREVAGVTYFNLLPTPKNNRIQAPHAVDDRHERRASGGLCGATPS